MYNSHIKKHVFLIISIIIYMSQLWLRPASIIEALLTLIFIYKTRLIARVVNGAGWAGLGSCYSGARANPTQPGLIFWAAPRVAPRAAPGCSTGCSGLKRCKKYK